MYEARSALQCNFAIHNTYTEYFLNRNQKGDFKMTKKIMSMILSIAMVLSIAVVGISGVSAAVDSDGRYVPSEGVETHRIYFAMPNSWKSAKYGADSAGIFWWNGSDTDGFVEGTERLAWPGYKMQVADAESNLYYVDLPTDVIAVIFNNALNGGERIVDDYGNVTYEFSEGQFMAANQTADIISGSYSEGDDDYYDNMLDGEFWSKAKAALNGERDTRLVEDPQAKPIWARYYDLKYCEPYVCDRDGLPRRHLEEIGTERRNGYSWYNSRPAELFAIYNAWADKYDPKHKVAISLATKGANENGLIEMYRRPMAERTAFDVVVKPGESIQAAIEKAPEIPTVPFKILLLNGTYHQKVIIDRPNIVLVGENRDSTRIVLAETAQTRAITEYHGRPVGNGVIVLQEGADDCVISGLTVYNNYGTAVENTTIHQMAIFGRATRTIIINSNVWADGNDALSLWAPGSNGMYYHADLYLRCPGVDFLCPRGWCYATRCHFYGDSRAMIWHDGRGDKNKKLVITNSSFDAKTPTLLGRYHHDSQFYLIKCKMSKNVLDGNIHYAYSDKVLDPCPWGLRTYYYGCTREGGHSGWLNDNLKEAENAPEFHGVTAKWTFNGKWDPEQRIRDLWNVLAY